LSHLSIGQVRPKSEYQQVNEQRQSQHHKRTPSQKMRLPLGGLPGTTTVIIRHHNRIFASPKISHFSSLEILTKTDKRSKIYECQSGFIFYLMAVCIVDSAWVVA
jgi:hypothetical protein